MQTIITIIESFVNIFDFFLTPAIAQTELAIGCFFYPKLNKKLIHFLFVVRRVVFNFEISRKSHSSRFYLTLFVKLLYYHPKATLFPFTHLIQSQLFWFRNLGIIISLPTELFHMLPSVVSNSNSFISLSVSVNNILLLTDWYLVTDWMTGWLIDWLFRWWPARIRSPSFLVAFVVSSGLAGSVISFIADSK